MSPSEEFTSGYHDPCMDNCQRLSREDEGPQYGEMNCEQCGERTEETDCGVCEACQEADPERYFGEEADDE